MKIDVDLSESSSSNQVQDPTEVRSNADALVSYEENKEQESINTYCGKLNQGYAMFVLYLCYFSNVSKHMMFKLIKSKTNAPKQFNQGKLDFVKFLDSLKRNNPRGFTVSVLTHEYPHKPLRKISGHLQLLG